MEFLDKITELLSQYGAIVIPVLAIVLEFALKTVESKKPMSLIDRGLDILGYAFYKLGLGPIERLIKKIREIYNAVLPERLKPEQPE